MLKCIEGIVSACSCIPGKEPLFTQFQFKKSQMSHFAASLPLGHIVAVAQFAHPQHTVKAAPEHIPAVVRAARNDIDFRMLTIKIRHAGHHPQCRKRDRNIRSVKSVAEVVNALTVE